MEFIVQDKNSSYCNVINSIINDRKKEIFSFFDSEEVELPFKVYIYASNKDLVEGLRNRGFSKDPDYMCACHKGEDNSLNFFEPKDNHGPNEWSKEAYKDCIFHELIHGIQFILFGDTPEWLNEGIAKYLDGEYSSGIKILLEEKINNRPIPNQYEIEHEFGEHREYDSYDYAFIMISYLIDTMGSDGLIDILRNKEKINVVKEGLLESAIDYYNNKYFGVKGIKR